MTDEELHVLRSLPEAEQVSHIGNDLEEAKCGTVDACQTDKSWVYMHAALTGTDPDGPLEIPLDPGPSKPSTVLGNLLGHGANQHVLRRGPERFAILGQSALLSTDDYYIGLVPKDAVAGVASALEGISTADLGSRVVNVHQAFKASGEPHENAEYAMGWYPGLVAFYRRAAEGGKHVIFTVDY